MPDTMTPDQTNPAPLVEILPVANHDASLWHELVHEVRNRVDRFDPVVHEENLPLPADRAPIHSGTWELRTKLGCDSDAIINIQFKCSSILSFWLSISCV